MTHVTSQKHQNLCSFHSSQFGRVLPFVTHPGVCTVDIRKGQRCHMQWSACKACVTEQTDAVWPQQRLRYDMPETTYWHSHHPMRKQTACVLDGLVYASVCSQEILVMIRVIQQPIPVCGQRCGGIISISACTPLPIQSSRGSAMLSVALHCIGDLQRWTSRECWSECVEEL